MFSSGGIRCDGSAYGVAKGFMFEVVIEFGTILLLETLDYSQSCLIFEVLTSSKSRATDRRLSKSWDSEARARRSENSLMNFIIQVGHACFPRFSVV